MLVLMLPEIDGGEAIELQFEHSLVSLSKWESIHEKPFFSREEKNEEELRSYIVQMLRSENPPENFGDRLTREHIKQALVYIDSKQTATTFRDDPNSPKSKEVITSELIYYWLSAFRIPFQPCEDWNLNRLLTLVRICGIKQTKPKRMSRQAQASEYRRLNEQRRQQLGTSG